jgi:hypothetical protein
MVLRLLSLFVLVSLPVARAQEQGVPVVELRKIINETLASKWYEKISVRGYAQFRYNRLFESNQDLKCPQCDRSIGKDQGFFMRRGRLIFFGEVSDRVFIYIQPDYASDAAGTQHYFQIRDAYFDYAVSEDKDWRLRFGMSKVPYGFQNLQSSSNRGPQDRDDALNSAVPNERDTGLYLMWSPTEVRRRYKELTNAMLKGSGDYGLFAIGAFNGQTANRPEQNNDLHRVVRLTYPWKLQNGQFIETSIQAYEGKFNTVTPNRDFHEQRAAASLVIYPQPLGFQAEYNVGRTPGYDRDLNTIAIGDLRGGYAMVYYNLNLRNQRLFPFVRYQYFDGAKKAESGAPYYEVKELEIGTEWQPNPALEVTFTFANSDRLTQSTATNRLHESGHMLRLQAQFNY